MAVLVDQDSEVVSPATVFDSPKRCVSVVVGRRRFDVVVDERLLLSDLLALLSPGLPLAALTMAGAFLPLDRSLAQADLGAGSMVIAVPRQSRSGHVVPEVSLPLPARPARARTIGVQAYRRAAVVWVAVVTGLAVLVVGAAGMGVPPAGGAAITLAAVALVSHTAPSLVLALSQRELLDGDLPPGSSGRDGTGVRHSGGVGLREVERRVRAAMLAQATLLMTLLIVALGGDALLGAQLWRAPSWSVSLLLVAVGTTSALAARGYRRVVDRVPLLLTATGCAVAVGFPCLMSLTPTQGAVAGAVAGVGAVIVVAVGRALGRGNRSPWASRAADLCALSAVVSTVPLALWSAGLVARAANLFG